MIDHIIAIEAFKGKTDKYGQPYIGHLERVAKQCHGDAISVAYLHDILEDCEDWTPQRLYEEGIEKHIIEAVMILTKQKDENYEDYIESVKTNTLALQVKIADLRDNMDISRIPHEMNDYEMRRLRKYHKAYLNLTQYKREVSTF